MRRPAFFLLVLAAAAAGCDKSDSAAAAPPATGGPAAPRAAGSVVLSGADLYTLAPDRIEVGIAISGGLRPIESIVIRARLEGDVVEVIAREGDRVAQGALLARFESTEQEAALRSAEADKLAAETEAKTAQWNFEQTRDLFRAGAVPEREFRAAEQAAATSAARLAASEARLRAAALVERDTRVVAPVAGTIERRIIQSGVRALRGGELFTLVRTDILELTAAVPARLADEVRIGQPVRFVADARRFDGRVARVSPTVDPASQSVTVYVQVPNGDGTLKGNSFATGQIVASAFDNQLLVPQQAVRQPAAGAGAAPFVWRLKGGVLERAVVKLGVVDEGRGVVQVLDGLAAGDQVVVGNVGMLGAGMQVQLIGGEQPAAVGAR
ncbi:efflux RND transporter periplasmic adaptor subunit [Pseudogemmatithrix spongiicola]|uniref:Efflux RND transporter periplasmic adaptor subunit n=1 Tax=Pseudogemmatithrix spongiicola TaxID=3062599 RepID=A0AA49JXA4_9BACT|nr:efflux RND transporter periplasmic adaptor subunit [Gemmatimonadaceae bacterium 'strain 138']WKW13764.1 efflux RND transporter periplasmic adaptor subunit [Gemmatimonadaceae bacterium 'strain 318']